jgi:Family of unknown function (DUF5808)
MARERRGRFLGIPYDWRRPTAARLRAGLWDPGDARVLVPKAWGWGYGINLAAVRRRLARGAS